MNLRKSVLATLAYYDALDYPLTAGEVFKFLINPNRIERGSTGQILGAPINLEKLIHCLDVMVNGGEIEEKMGFYFLAGRSLLCAERLERNKVAEQKWKKARRYLFLIQAVPYVEVVFASGSLALGHTSKESDLDVLVVARSGRIWLARLLVTLLMNFLRVRRKNKEQIAPDKICLNHYITTASLKIPFESLYNAQTYAHLVPVYWREEKTIKLFWEENKGWINKFLCRWDWPIAYQRRAVRHSRFLQGVKLVLEKILNLTKSVNLLEKLSRKLQIARINTNLPGRVVANDQQLEFHPYSFEKVIIQKYNQTISILGIFGEYFELDSGLR